MKLLILLLLLPACTTAYRLPPIQLEGDSRIEVVKMSSIGIGNSLKGFAIWQDGKYLDTISNGTSTGLADLLKPRTP